MADVGLEIPIIIPTGDAKLTLEQLARGIDTVVKAEERLVVQTRGTSEVFIGFKRAIGEDLLGAIKSLAGTAVSSLQNIASLGEDIANGAQRIGVSSEGFQKLKRAAEVADVSVELLGRSALVLQRNLVNAAPALEKFGISSSKIRALDTDKQFLAVAEAIKKITDPAKQAAAAQEILRDRGGKLLQFIRSDFNAAFERTTAITNENVAALAALDDSFDFIKGSAEDVKNQFLAGIASADGFRVVVDFLQQKIQQLAVFFRDNQTAIRDFVNNGILFAAQTINSTLIPTLRFGVDVVEVFSKSFVIAQEVFEKIVVAFGAAGAAIAAPTDKFKVFTDTLDVGFKNAEETAGKSFASIESAAALANRGIDVVQNTTTELVTALKQGAPAAEAFAAAQQTVETQTTLTKESIKALVSAAEAELKVATERSKLQSLVSGFNASETEKAIQAAQDQAVAADAELATRLKILDIKRQEAKLTKEGKAAIDAEKATLVTLNGIQKEITAELIRQAQALLRQKLIQQDVTLAAERRKSQEQASAINDALLLGQEKLEAAKKRQIALLNIEHQANITLLQDQLDLLGPGDAGREVIERQIDAKEDLHAQQLRNIEAEARLAERAQSVVLSIVDQIGAAQSLNGVIGAVASGAGQLVSAAEGIVGGFNNLRGAIDQGGNAFQRAFNVGKAGANLGGQIGALAGPVGQAWGTVIGGLAGVAIGIFRKPSWQKVGEEAGKILGQKVSEEMARAIEASSKELGISVRNATLLALPQAIAESGRAASEFSDQITQLLEAVASGAVPATEGIAALDASFAQLAADVEKTGVVADRTLTKLLQDARRLGQVTPEMKAFVAAQLGVAVAGVEKFINSLTVISKEDFGRLGTDSAAIFGATFSALVGEAGIVAAVDALGESFTTLKETLTKNFGAEQAGQLLSPFAAAFDLLQDEKLRPLVEGIDGLGQVLKGLGNAGFLDLDTFSAIQRSAAALFDQLIAGGADTRTSLLAIAPTIQAAITAAEQFGIPLDADTQRLKDLAEQNGITFKTDPQQAMLDVLVSIAEVLGADIPESARRAEQSIRDLADAAPSEISVAGPEAGAVPPGGGRGFQIEITPIVEIKEIPLQSAQSVAQLQALVANTVADAVEDQIPALQAALRT